MIFSRTDYLCRYNLIDVSKVIVVPLDLFLSLYDNILSLINLNASQGSKNTNLVASYHLSVLHTKNHIKFKTSYSKKNIIADGGRQDTKQQGECIKVKHNTTTQHAGLKQEDFILQSLYFQTNQTHTNDCIQKYPSTFSLSTAWWKTFSMDGFR